MAFPHMRLGSGDLPRQANRAIAAYRLLSGNLTGKACLRHSLLDREKIAHFFPKVNPLVLGKSRSKMGFCRRRKNAGAHNGLVTDFYKRLHNVTAYVNKCNFLTRDIAKSDGRRRISWSWVYIIFETIICKKLTKNAKNKEKLDILELFDIIKPPKEMRKTKCNILIPFIPKGYFCRILQEGPLC